MGLGKGRAMTDSYTPTLRALVAATLLPARAAGALAIGACGAFGEAHDFRTVDEARKSALAKCQSDTCRVVTVAMRGCAVFAVDFANACGAHGWGKAPKLGRSQNEALRSCYKEGGKECVIRTFFCDAKG